ncbi:hypothetical protein HDV03_001677 [Kappamyces sp. JEL0829]|nr:hypothetical protein HDV03_001677 [Kappamyces sp. JEL0829]
MPCSTCEKKLKTARGASSSGKDAASKGGKAVNENKLLAAKASKRAEPYVIGSSCKTCKAKLNVKGMYCHNCSYKKGLCSICGIKILDTSRYVQRTV